MFTRGQNDGYDSLPCVLKIYEALGKTYKVPDKVRDAAQKHFVCLKLKMTKKFPM